MHPDHSDISNFIQPMVAVYALITQTPRVRGLPTFVHVTNLEKKEVPTTYRKRTTVVVCGRTCTHITGCQESQL